MPGSIDVTVPPRLRTVLWLSVPVAAGAMVASAAGLFWSGSYAAETANWAAQGRGQDAVNLVVYPLLLVLAWRAARGSVSALLGWSGIALYSAYSYLLYAGWVHFDVLFLVYVLTFGLSVYALVGALVLIDPGQLRAAFRPSVPERAVGTVLAVVGMLFVLLWLSEIVPSLVDGSPPPTLVDAGLVSSPVWVLDLGIVLPAMVLAGVLLRRGRPLGYLLAVPLLAFVMTMGVAVIGMFVSLALAGESAAVAPGIMIGLAVVVETAALGAFVQHLRPDVRSVDVLRQTEPPARSVGHARVESVGPSVRAR